MRRSLSALGEEAATIVSPHREPLQQLSSQRQEELLSYCVRQPIAWQSSRSIMGNLALHSAEEPDNLRATTGTVEVLTIRDNDAALTLGARPIQQHEPAARHNGANVGPWHTSMEHPSMPCIMHMAQSPDQQPESLPRYDDSPSLFVPVTPEGTANVTRQLFGAVEESPGMTPSSSDSAYASRPMESDAAQWTTPAFSEDQTPRTGASASTLAPSPTTERAEKPEQTPELLRKGRRASPSPRLSPKERHRSQTR